MVGAETDPVLAQARARVLVEIADHVRHVAAEQNAEIFSQPECEAARQTFQVLGMGQIVERLEHRSDLVIDVAVETGGHDITGLAFELIVGQKHDTRLQHMIAGDQATHGITQPAQSAVAAEREIAVARSMQARGPCLEFKSQRLLRGSRSRLGIRGLGRLVDYEPESGQLADMVAFDEDIPVHTYFRFEHRIFSQPPHEHRCPAVNEAFRQPFMQCIGQSVLYFSCLFLPVCRIGKPMRTIGNIRPRSDLRNPRCQRVDVARCRIAAPHLFGDIILAHSAVPHKVTIDRRDQIRMLGRRNAPVIRECAHVPQEFHRLRRGRHVANLEVAGEMFERPLIDRRKGTRQSLHGRRLLQAFDQRLKARKIEQLRAPLEDTYRVEHVAFQPLDQFILERRHTRRHPESTVAHMASGTARDLGKFSGRQTPVRVAVEFSLLGEGDMVDIEIEPHADRVGGNEEIDIAVLVEFDLRVAGPRAERAENHGSASTLATDQLGDCIDLVSGKGDDGRSARQPRDLLRSCIKELREPRSFDDSQPGQQVFKNAAHARRSEQQSFLAASQA